MAVAESDVAQISADAIRPNPHNPRRYFNEEALDLLRTSIDQVGVLVPLIVYEDPDEPGSYVLLDGERRWRCARDLGLSKVPANVIPAPTTLNNLLRMFNIHAVREEWPLVALALSLRDVMQLAGEDREVALSELTGLPRGQIRRAKRLLALPLQELELIKNEAHLPRSEQIHREDLYLEISDAESAIRKHLPEVASEFSREKVIRQFARKRERNSLQAITDFRLVPKLVRGVRQGFLDRNKVEAAIKTLITDVGIDPVAIFEQVGGAAFDRQEVLRRADVLSSTIAELNLKNLRKAEAEDLRAALRRLRKEIDAKLSP